MPDVLVLGADGFIGSHVCDALLDRGLSVRAFDRFQGGRVRNVVRQDQLEIFPGDFLNRNDLERALADDVRFVFHLVSTTTPATSGSDPAFDIETNVRGSVELFELCARANVERTVFASTGGAIYGQDLDRPLRETDRTVPVSPYAIGKLAIEGYLRFFRHSRGLDSRVLRISNPYGERQPIEGAQGAVPIFLRRMLLGEPITVFGNGSMVRDYIYIQDAARMMAATVDRAAEQHVFNLASGTSLSVLELLRALEDAVGVTPVLEHGPDRPTDVHRVVLDTSRFEAAFGTFALTSLDEGLRRTAQHVRTLVEAGGAG